MKRNLFTLSALFILFGLHAANEYSGIPASRNNTASPITFAPSADMVTVNFIATPGGQVAVRNADFMMLTSGARVEQGSVITILIRANAGYLIQSVTINGDDKTAECSPPYGYDYTANADVNIIATFVEAPPAYCINNLYRSSDGRSLKSCNVRGATVKGVGQVFSSTLFTEQNQDKVYVDRVGETLNASLGDELTIFLESMGVYEWMHFYVFIDYNQNFTFEQEELVSFSYLNGVDSKGNPANEQDLPFSNTDPDKHLPEFTIPDTASLGATRMRIVSQWNSSDPCGAAGIETNKGTILDYTINIHTNATYPVTFAQPVTGGSFTVKKGGTEIQTGTLAFAGDSLEISFLPATGYQLKRLTINGQNYFESVENNSFKYEVTGNTNIEVEFENGSAIAAFRENETIVYVNPKGDLVIEGAPVGSRAQIYNLMGQPVRDVSILSNKEIVSGNYLSKTICIIKLNYKNRTSVHKVISK
jgi:hypothetical protein